MVPASSRRIPRAPRYSGYRYHAGRLRISGFHALRPLFPKGSSRLPLRISRSYYPARALTLTVWAAPRSLAATGGISVDFFSSGYLDVSVLPVRSTDPMCSGRSTPCGVGFPIRTSPDQSYIASSPKLFAGLHVLRRLSSPRHPPDALIRLIL